MWRTAVVAMLLLAGLPAQADVFNMPSGLTSVKTVTVGNAGNTGELSGGGAGGFGPDRVCGAVDYAFGISTFEITAGQYVEFLNAVAATDTHNLYSEIMWTDIYGCKIQRSGSPGSYEYSVATADANRPVNNVSWGDAARFANWLTNGQRSGDQDASTTEAGSYELYGATSGSDLLAVCRIAEQDRIPGRLYYFIPTEDEWYKAAYHKNDGPTSNYWDYPTASDIAPGNDPSEVTNPGNNANYDGTYTTPVGEFELSTSPYGTFDQGGNVLEWTEAVISDTNRGLRGGSVSAAHGIDYLMASYRNSQLPDIESSNYGFRVSVVPEPCTLALAGLGLAGIGLSRVRRRV